VTTAANDALRPLHDRMPVILPEPAWDRWLDRDFRDTAALAPLLVPAPDDVLEAYPVSPLVGKADNDGPELVRRVDPGEPFPEAGTSPGDRGDRGEPVDGSSLRLFS
jgi:putative SOS response-associated peptidase YedK